MSRYLKLLAVACTVAVVAVACGGGDEGGGEEEAQDLQSGGTMSLQMISDVDAAFDPQKEYYQVTWGFYRCCLLRTLVSYNGKDEAQGGNELHPDLATDLPELSEDGLTYTFTIKDDVQFGPPFEDQEITAQSFINAMEREATPEVGAGYSFYYSVIEGFDEFNAGDADSISGMTAVDDKTLEITLTRPTGDFPFRMAMPAAAPIPDGAADGHDDDYGRFLVASGPYMFEGSEEMDFSLPPDEQDPVAGYNPGRSIVLVRNPSWKNDDLRPAYIDRFETTIGGTEQDMFQKIEAGELDLHLDGVPPAQFIRQYQTTPDLQDRFHVNSADGVRYVSFNLAEPPFDDVHVRKAVNFALDKDGYRRIRGGETTGEIAGHVIVDGLLDDKLADYDPYATPNGAGDIEAAKAEMAQSQYDTDGDGVCDDPVCEDVLTAIDEAAPYPDQTALTESNLEPLGITLDVRSFERTTMYDSCNDPGSHTALCQSPGWGKDYSDASTFGEPLFGSVAIGPDSCCNYSLVGAPADLLEEHDYSATDVGSVDDKVTECDSLPIGDERIDCWVELDQMLMEDIVPWVPYLFDNDLFISGERVLNFQYDQFAGQPALDQMALQGAGGE